MILLDASAALAWVDDREPAHAGVARAADLASAPIVVSPFVLAEIDYHVATRLGQPAESRFLAQFESGALSLAPFDARDVAAARRVLDAYADLNVGLADASIVVLAHLHRTADVLTLDERHFRVLPGPGGRPFRILPADLPA